MPTRAINCPTALLALAEQHDASRTRVLLAAMRAVCGAPPPAPVAYPALVVAARRVRLDVSVDLLAALRVVERRLFYGRAPWALVYALVHHGARVEEILRLDAGALARLDAAVLLALSEVSSCIVPLTTRVPRAPKQPRR